jgi:LPXTG-site transpeptidase (sortase) family protein
MRIIGVIVVLILIGMFLWTVTSSSFSVQAELTTEAQSVQPGFGTQIQVEDHPQRLPGNSTSRQEKEPLQIPPQKHADDDLTKSVKESPVQKTKDSGEKDQPLNEFERLVIPTLKVDAQLISKPYSQLSWDLTDLGHSIALLGDISEQETKNNTVLAGHVTVRNGSNGPFRYLSRLNSGDKLILYTERSKYTFIVREQVLVYPEETSVIKDTPHPQLTLITCTTWDEKTLSYLRRRVVFADLEKVELIVMLAD